MANPSALDIVLIDGYVDEPAHFGVPPYLSTYPRYTAGALVDAGATPKKISYFTIDEARDTNEPWLAIESADFVIYLGGMTVPGKYVGGTPAEPHEVQEIAWTATSTTLLGGPVRFGVGERNEGASEMERDNLDYDFVAKGDVEAAAFDLVTNDLTEFSDRLRTNKEINDWATRGAFIVEQHPNHPDYLICELETSRGCPYRCSFCTEPLYGNDPSFRDPGSIHQEVRALHDHSIRNFRLGRQADILAYGGDGESPNPTALQELYTGIHEAAPELSTLHLDNMNPVTIVRWPDQSRECIRTIAKYNTAGDTAAFGLESADPLVQEKNNLNVTTDECFDAIKIVNEEGGYRDSPSHLPKLLPGINLVHGLKGERPETYEYNRKFLHQVLDADLLVRRINIRQVMAFPGTDMSSTGATIAESHKKQFKQYKQEIRETIDQPFLQRVAPSGTVLPDVHLEYHENDTTFGRQLGTYPLLVGIPGTHELGQTFDVAIVDHGYRSVTGVPWPLDINSASMSELTSLPEIGNQRAGTIIVNRPFDSPNELTDLLSIDLTDFIETQQPSRNPSSESSQA